MAGIKIYLKYSSKDKLQLPVVPEELTLESPFGVNKVNVAHKGAVTIPGYRDLKSISLDSFFPKHYNAGYCSYKSFKAPETIRKKIEKWRNARKPLQLIITGFDISMPVLIEEFDCSAKAGEPGDIYYKMKLIQDVKPPSTKVQPKKKKASVKNAGKKGTRAPKTSKKTVTKNTKYTVKKGDCLWNISKKYYGDATKWRRIYSANKKVIGANPDLIYPGQKLVIPK